MMRKCLLASALFVAALFAAQCSSAFAWNNKGHMVVARLAYLQLSSDERAAAQAILQQHPHYDEFLKASKPHNLPVEEWVFWRAATWPDWVKFHHREYSHKPWHYIDYPFVPPGSSVDPASHQPNPENAVNALPKCIELAKSGTAEEKAINLCWILHLIGDLQQPLHCASLFSEEFPDGDRGGNAARYRIGERVIKLHSFWDGLLGRSESVNSIRGSAHDSLTVAHEHQSQVAHDLEANVTVEDWAKEGFENAVRFAYLDGSPVPANEEQDPSIEDIPAVPESYATNAGLVARLAMVKGGERLAKMLRSILD